MVSFYPGLKLRVQDKIMGLFSYATFPVHERSTPVDWKLLETEDIQGEHIRCHQLLGNELLPDLFEQYRKSDTKAVILVNSVDTYRLSDDLLVGVEKPHLPVVILTKQDGTLVLECLDETKEVDEDVYAKIDVETDVDGGGGAGDGQLAVGGSQQQYLSPHSTPKKQQPESSISEF